MGASAPDGGPRAHRLRLAAPGIPVILLGMRTLPMLALVVAALALLAGPAPASPPLRLMTYNVNYANANVPATLDAIAREDADVVLLQEITREWERALVERFAAPYPYRSFRLHARAAGGLAVLSRHPIRAEDVWPPPRGGWFPAARLVIDAPAGAVQVLHLHLRPCLDGGSWVKGWHTTPPIRRREIESYWARVAADLPTIVAGDFNEPPDGAAIAFLAGRGLVRVPTAGPTTWHYEATSGGARRSLLSLDIDHVLVDANFVARAAWVRDAGTSDHRPVVVTLARAAPTR